MRNSLIRSRTHSGKCGYLRRLPRDLFNIHSSPRAFELGTDSNSISTLSSKRLFTVPGLKSTDLAEVPYPPTPGARATGREQYVEQQMVSTKNTLLTGLALLQSNKRTVESCHCDRQNANSPSSFTSPLPCLVVCAICVCLLATTTGVGFAQSAPESGAAAAEVPGKMSRQEWLERVQRARQQAKETALEHRLHPERYTPSPDDKARIASERALNDDILQPGDIVSTGRGLFVFRGSADRPPKSEDFVPLPNR